MLDKILRREPGEFQGEGEDDGGLEMGGGEVREALVVGGEAEGGGVGAQDFGGKRVEGEDGGDGVELLGAGDRGAKDGLMAEMGAVEIADGESAAVTFAGEAFGPGGGGGEDRDIRRKIKSFTLKSDGGGTHGETRGGVARLSVAEVGIVDGEFDCEAVVGEMDIGVAESAQALGGFGVGQVVGDVGEPGAARVELLDEGEGLIHGLVHGMGNVAECIEDQFVEILQQSEGGVGKGAEVGEVGGAAEAVAEDFEVAVEKRDGSEGDAEKLEGLADFAKGDTGNGAELGETVEDVREGAAQGLEGGSVGIDGKNGVLAEVVRADVVEAHDVVGVSVGEEDGVEAIEFCAQGLLAKIGRGVNDDELAVAGEEQGRAEAIVAGIGGGAHAAMATGRGHAHGGAGAEDGDG